MPQWLGLLWLLLFLFVSGWALSTGLVPLTTRRLSSLNPPHVLRRRLWLTAAMPVLFPAVAICTLVVLALAKQWGWVADHCPVHNSGHPHFCFAHLPELTWNLFHPLFVGFLVSALLFLFVRRLSREWRQQRRVNALERMASRRGNLRILGAGPATAFAAGLRHPHIFVSRHLLSGLSARERRILLAHEVAHIRHRDMIGQLLFDCLLLFHLPASARTLRRCRDAAQERMADDHAVTRFGALDVAATLVKLARQARGEAPVATAVLGDQPAARIERILNPQGTEERRPFFEIGFTLAIAMLVALTLTSHHSLETLLGYLPGV